MTTSLKTLSNAWWRRLDPARRQAWLDAAASDRRERTAESAFELKLHIESGASLIRVYVTPAGRLVGQIIHAGQVVFSAGDFNTEAELRAALSQVGFLGLPILHAQFLIDLATEVYDEF